MTKLTKTFFYDSVLDAQNICNLEKERDALLTGVFQGKKLVVYGRRNFGKTSLIKSVIIPEFQKQNKKSFVLFCDLMEVKSLDAISQRVQKSFAHAFNVAFPGQSLVDRAKELLTSLRPTINLDPLTGMPSLSLEVGNKNPVSFNEILNIVHKKISKKYKVLIIFDEFQDIAFVDEAQGLFRQALQEFRGTPIIVLGSKHHLLSQIFSMPEAPLAGFGEDIEFKPIDYKKYHHYIQERFDQRKLKIDFETAKDLQDLVHRVPESINILCANIYESKTSQNISIQDIRTAFEQSVERRQSRYEELLGHLTEKDEAFLIALAKHGPIPEPSSKNFLQNLGLSSRGAMLKARFFLDHSMIEKSDEGYRISDPLLERFLKTFR